MSEQVSWSPEHQPAYLAHIHHSVIAKQQHTNSLQSDRASDPSHPADRQPDYERYGLPAQTLIAPMACKAVAAAILSQFLQFLPFITIIPAIAGIVFAVKARTSIRQSGGRLRGSTMAIAALIMSSLAILVSVSVWVPAFFSR